MSSNQYKLEKYLRKYKQTSEMKYLDKVMYYLRGGIVCSKGPPKNCDYPGFDIKLVDDCNTYEKECVKIGTIFISNTAENELIIGHNYYICDINDTIVTVYDIDENKSYFTNSKKEIKNILGKYCDNVYLKTVIPKAKFLDYETNNKITYLTQNPLFKR
jgi:hypothetical protein